MQVRARIVLVDTTADLQAVIDRLPAGGGVISLGAGTFNTTGLVIDKPLLIQGSGMDTTILQMDPTLVNVDIISVESSHVVIEDLSVYGPNSAGSGRGIVYTSGDVIWKCGLTRVKIHQTAAECLSFPNSDGGTAQDSVILSSFNDCWFRENCSGGEAVYIGWQHTTLEFHNCAFSRFRGAGLYMEYAYGCVFDGCSFEEPLTDTAPSAYLNNCASNTFKNCWFENTTDQQSQYHIGGAGACIGNVFDNCSMHFGPRTDVYPGAVNGPHTPRCVYMGYNYGFCTGNVFRNLWAYIELGSRAAAQHIVFGENCRDNQVIGGGISDLRESNVTNCALASGVVTRGAGSFSAEGISVGDPVYPIVGHIPNGAYVSVVGALTMTIAVHGGGSLTDGIGLQVITNPGGKTMEFAIYDLSLTRPTTVQTAQRTRLPRLTTAQRNALDTPTTGDMAWITDATAGQEWQVYNGAAWKYLSQN
jgi:hypothetical protein